MKTLPPSFTHPGHTPGVISSVCVEKGMLWNSGWKFFLPNEEKEEMFQEKRRNVSAGRGIRAGRTLC